MSVHLVYGKVLTKFEQFWYYKSKLEIHLKTTSQYDVQTYFTLKILIYYDCNMHNLTIHKYLLNLHKVKIF
jgi:hypothetical protein